jgi:C-terminal processing protease CtpA/Prc
MTPAWVPGRRFGTARPVYVLISNRTFSAAEGFTYDLQALGRVTVVGQRSGGGAHPFEYRRAHPHFVLSLAEGRSINPITGSNWQGTGVVPDVEVPADQALDVALKLARAAMALP